MAKRMNRVAWGLVGGLGTVMVSAVGVLGWWLWPALEDLSGDPISAAGLRTERQLFLYERTQRPEALRQWLTTYQGDATGHQVMMTLAEWSVEHPDQFLKLVEGINEDQRPVFVQRFVAGLGDTNCLEEFHQVFRGHTSPAVEAIIQELRSGPASR